MQDGLRRRPCKGPAWEGVAKLPPAQLRAHAEACEEAAAQRNWTDDPMEREERDRVTRLLQAECEKYRAIANAREFNGPRVLALCTRKIC